MDGKLTLTGATQLPGEVVVTRPDPTDMCECGDETVMTDRFTIQRTENDETGIVVVWEPMFLGRKCWDREIRGEDDNHHYGVIAIRLA